MRRGITPVVAIALLLGMTVAASGGAYTFISSAQQSAQEEASSALATTVEARAATCGRGVIDLALKNTGDTTVSTAEADLFVYERGNLHTSRSDIDLSSYTLGPTDLIRPKLFVPDVLETGTRYTVEIRFPQDDVTVETTCIGFEDVGASGIWTFSGFENGTAVADTGNSDGTFGGETWNDGTLGSGAGSDSSDPTWVEGRYGTGLRLDGTDDYAVMSDAPFDITGEITMMAWVKPETLQNSVILNKLGSNAGYRFIVRSDSLQFSYGNGSTLIHQGISNGISTGDWHHVAVTWDEQTLAAYVNGKRTAFAHPVSGSWQENDRNFYLVGSSPQGLGGDRYHGVIDEVRIYDRVLNASEINASMNAHWPVADPVASWSFEEGSGQTAHDTHEKVQGRTGGGIFFDGLDDTLDVASPAIDLDAGNEFTGCAWIHPRSGDERPGIITYRDALILDYQYNHAELIVDEDWSNSLTSAALPLRTWYHLCGVYDNATARARLYVDGDRVDTFDKQYDFAPSSADLRIGYRNTGVGTQYFNGTVDEVQVYPYAVH